MSLLKKKTSLLFTVVMLLTGYASNAFPTIGMPRRCIERLTQEEARGRNQWLKKCHPTHYKLLFPGGIESFNSYDPSRLVYPTYGKITGLNDKGEVLFEPVEWIAPTVAPASKEDPSCQIPDQIEFIGLCSTRTDVW